jgi:putative transposase
MVRPADRRRGVNHARERHGVCTSRACRLLNITRSTYRYTSVRGDDAALRHALLQAAHERRRWGYRRLLVLLRRHGFVDNHKRVYRLYCDEGLQVRRRKRRKTARWRGEKPTAPARPRQRWSLDFVHDTTSGGRRFRALNIVDDFTRECLWIEVDTSISGDRVARILDHACEVHGAPASLLMDNGPEFRGQAVDCWAYNRGITLQFIQPGKPVQNAWVESFNGKFRDECLNEHWFLDLNEARSIIEDWRDDYNQRRPHSSLDYQTPDEFAAAWHAGKIVEGKNQNLIPPGGDQQHTGPAQTALKRLKHYENTLI